MHVHVEHAHTQVTGLKGLGEFPRLTGSMKRARSMIWVEGACQRLPSMTKAVKHRGKSRYNQHTVRDRLISSHLSSIRNKFKIA